MWIGVVVLAVLGAAIFAAVRSRIVAVSVIEDAEIADERADETRRAR